MKKYEIKDNWNDPEKWYPVEPSTTIDGRLVQWMEDNFATHVVATFADRATLEVRRVAS